MASANGGIAGSKSRHALVVRRLRALGPGRIVYRSDAAVHVASEYASFRTLPLTDAEVRMIEANVAPCMR